MNNIITEILFRLRIDIITELYIIDFRKRRNDSGKAAEKEKNAMMTKKEFETRTNWKMSYAEYLACACWNCRREGCPHRDAFRRVPAVDGGLGLCPNLKGFDGRH